MNKAKIAKDFPAVRRAFPSAIFSETLNYLKIPEIQLPAKFTPPTSPLLIHLHPESDYREPEWYVRRDLRVFGLRSDHLDEYLTPSHMLDNGWVKFCIRQQWSPNYTLVEVIMLALKFLKGLED